MPRYFYPLSELLPDGLIPEDLFAIEDRNVLSLIGVSEYRVTALRRGLAVAAGLAVDPDADRDPELLIALPQFPDLGLVLRTLGRLEMEIEDEFRLTVALGAFSLRLPPAFLKPVTRTQDGRWVPDEGREYVEVVLTYRPEDGIADPYPLHLTVDSRGAVDVAAPFVDGGGGAPRPVASLNGPAMVGDTGLVIDVRGVTLNLDPEDPWLAFDAAEVVLPSDLTGDLALPAVEFADATLSRRGFSGTVAAIWPLGFENGEFVYQLDGTPRRAELAGLNGGLRQIALSFVENQLTASEISGGLVIPYFEEPVDIRLNMASSGDFTVTLLGLTEDGIDLTKEELLALNVKALTVARRGDVGEVVVSGELEPLLMASDGLEWPRLDVTDLAIDTTGKLSIREAWIDLKELATLDLWGFHFELSRIGLGYEEASDRLWVDLSGSLRLIEQIPVGLGVEGFRLTWPRTLHEMLGIDELLRSGQSPSPDQVLEIASHLEVKFEGIYLFWGVPDAVEFEGLIRFVKEAQLVAFAGDVALRVPATGFAVEAGLMVGMSFDPPFPFLYVFLGVELPAGIPLGQSGLALKGALGLLGLNVSPAKAPEENWYYDWYKRGPSVGAHPTDKWQAQQMAVALGVGVTITTVDGYIKGVRGLLVLALPGPILVIEGRALIFDGLLPAEPPLRALAVFDGRERIVQFNIEAEATLIEDMLEAYGGLEAFFDFKDLTNWHLYLGQDEPANRRIQANVFKLPDAPRYLFDANAYLMLDMVGDATVRSRMGAFIGFKQTFKEHDPLVVDLDAWIEGHGVVTLFPEQFSGEVELEAGLTLSAFGFGLQLVATADVLSEGPAPISVEARLKVAADLPAPLPDFEAELHIAWEEPLAPEVVSPLVGAVADSSFVPRGGALELSSEQTLPKPELTGSAADVGETLAADTGRLAAGTARDVAEGSTVVPLDACPTLVFGHDMNNPPPDGAAEAARFGRDGGGELMAYDAGRIRLTPYVCEVELYEHRVGAAWDEDPTHDEAQRFEADWALVATTRIEPDVIDEQKLWGVWLADAAPEDPAAPAARRLRLWTANPLVHTRGLLGPGYGRILGLAGPRDAPAETVLRDYPDLQTCRDTEPAEVCVDFADAPAPDRSAERATGGALATLVHKSLTFVASGSLALDRRRAPPTIAGVRVDSARVDAARAALLDLVRSFARLGRAIPVPTLRAWARALSEWVLAALAREWPILAGVGARITTCLVVAGTLHVRFPEPVARVRIRFCVDPELKPDQARRRLAVRRRARTRKELDEAREKKIDPDLTGCIVDVAYEIGIDGRVWTIEATGGFDCLRLVGPAKLEAICYVAVAEVERAARAARQCETNRDVWPYLDAVPPLLEPDSYYRLIVKARVDTRVIPAEGDSAVSEAIADLMDDLYEAAYRTLTGGEELERTFGFLQEGFFRTEGPPHALAPYVKWSSPELQAPRVFREDDLLIRFRRPYLERMFEHEPHRLEVLVRDARGGVVGGYETTWARAASASQLPEEETWLAHLDAIGDRPTPPPDDVLAARRPVLFAEDFGDPALAGWQPVDMGTRGGPGSTWRAADGILRSLTPIFGGSVARDDLTKPGTLLVAARSMPADVVFTATLCSDSGDAIGVVFRYRDERTHYRFSMDHRQRYRRLVRLRDGVVTLLAEVDEGYEPGLPYEVEVAVSRASGQAMRIAVRLNGRPCFDRAIVDDQPIPPGRIGLYAWRNAGAAFSAVRVCRAGAPALAPATRYELQIVGGAGGALLPADLLGSPPAGWSIVGEELRSASGAAPRLIGDPAWTDLDIAVEVRPAGGGRLGIVFRHAEVLDPDELGVARRDTERLAPTGRERGPGGAAQPAPRDVEYRVTLSRSARACTLERRVGPSTEELGRRTYPTADEVCRVGEWCRLRVSAIDHHIRVWKSGQLLFDVTVERGPPRGRVGLFANVAGVAFRRLEVREAVLHRVPFTTSRFRRFRDLVLSFDGRAVPLPAGPWPTDPESGPTPRDLAAASGAFAEQVRAWEQAEPELRDELIDRQGVEDHRLALRQARADLDAAFRGVAERAGLPIFDPPPSELEIYTLRAAGAPPDGDVVGFWVRGPESLDLRRIVPGQAEGADPEYVGRTALTLERATAAGDAWEAVRCTPLGDADSAQLLLVPTGAIPAGPGSGGGGDAEGPAAWSGGQWRLRFTYHRDHGDERRVADHRYDRPIQQRDGATAEEAAILAWQS